MLSQSSLGLLLDPGLGKTATWLGAFCTLKALGYVNKMLVVAPLLPMYGTWPTEIDKYEEFKHLTWCFLHGPDKDYNVRNVDADIYFINPEGIQWLVDAVDPSTIADVLCVDESTKFKNSGSKRFKALRRIFPKFDRRWIGTGTPAPNGLEDLFAQIFILDGGAALGQYISHFRNRWFYTEPWNQYKYIPQPQALGEITDAIAPLVIQMSAEDYLDMPPLFVVDKRVQLPEQAMKLYKEIETDFIGTNSSTESVLVAPSAAAAGAKCRQIANGAVYTEHPEWERVHNAKLEMLDELCEEIGEHPILIVYEFQHDADRITCNDHLNWPNLTGMSGSCLTGMLDKFNAGKIPRLLIQSSKAHGLNIQAACHHMIWFGLTWNWEDYKQMVDRLYRQGQKANMVMVYRILAEGTLDIEVAARLKEKYLTEHEVKKQLEKKRSNT